MAKKKSEKKKAKKTQTKPVKKNSAKKATVKKSAAKKDTKKKDTKNKKSGSMKNATSKKATKEKAKPKVKSTKDNKKNAVAAAPKKTKEEKSKKKEIVSTKKENKKKISSKPKTKKEYIEEDDDILEDDLLNKDEIEDDEEVTEVEEIDLSNIEPTIADTEPLLDEDEEEEYVPKTRGRKKQIQPETHHQQTMEEIIRNRPLQIDPTQKSYVTKKEDEPKPYTVTKSNKERYSDKELQEFKEIILQRLKETKENYDQLKKYFTNQDDNGIDDTSPTFKMIEDGSGVMTKEEIEQQLSRLEKYMVDLQNALLRIENKTYGICTVTGKLIPKERLKSVPHATKSIEAKISRDN